MNPPLTLGHEPYGTVIAAGPHAGEAPIGQDRLVCPWIGCGTCARCLEGQDNHCMAPRWVGVQQSGGYAIICWYRIPLSGGCQRRRCAVGRHAGLLGLHDVLRGLEADADSARRMGSRDGRRRPWV